MDNHVVAQSLLTSVLAYLRVSKSGVFSLATFQGRVELDQVTRSTG
jgi:hypothetical protein